MIASSFLAGSLLILALPAAAFAQSDKELREKEAARTRPPKIEIDEAKQIEHAAESPPGNLRMFMSPMSGTVPRRLSPGGDGELVVILAIQRQSILRPEDHFEVGYPSSQGAITLGDWSRDAAEIGRLETAYRGRAVYDNTATLRVPMRVAADAKHERHLVKLTIECDLARAETGQFQGRYTMEFPVAVEVGDPLPTPAKPTRGAARRDRAEVPAAGTTEPLREPSRASQATDGGDPPTAVAPDPGPRAGEPTGGGPGPDSGSSDDGGSPTTLALLLAAVAVAVVVVLLARGRASAGA